MFGRFGGGEGGSGICEGLKLSLSREGKEEGFGAGEFGVKGDEGRVGERRKVSASGPMAEVWNGGMSGAWERGERVCFCVLGVGDRRLWAPLCWMRRRG